MESLQDIESQFEYNDVNDESLIGWDSEGRYFEINWDLARSCGYPVPGNIDLGGLEEKVSLFLQHRTDDHPYFVESDVVDGECSPRVMKAFLDMVKSKHPI